jgi:hypothetical protein
MVMDKTIILSMTGGLYEDRVQHCKWKHFIAIDTKAQNGPRVPIDICHAARALNVVLAPAPVNIALSASSPVAPGDSPD